MSESTQGERPESAMASGSDAGSPGQREESLDAPDEVAAAVADDAPLPPGSDQVGRGRDQDDGLTPQFTEPPPAEPDGTGF